MRGTGWWDRRILGGFMSYLIYQHWGNLSPRELAEDEMFQLAEDEEDVDLTERAAGLRLPRRPRGRGHALELLPRHRPGARRDARLARRPRARAGRAQHDRPARDALDRGARAQRRRRPPAAGHLAAAVPDARRCTTSRPGTRRSATAPGAAPAAWVGEKIRQGARPRALGGVPRLVRVDVRADPRRRHGRARRAAGDDRRAVGRRPPRLPGRGRLRRRAPACARTSGRRSARRSATRSTRASGG